MAHNARGERSGRVERRSVYACTNVSDGEGQRTEEETTGREGGYGRSIEQRRTCLYRERRTSE